MRKAIQLRVMLWIEGEDPPAHDFAHSTILAVREIIAVGSQAYPDLEVRVKKINEDANFDDEDDAKLAKNEDT